PTKIVLAAASVSAPAPPEVAAAVEDHREQQQAAQVQPSVGAPGWLDLVGHPQREHTPEGDAERASSSAVDGLALPLIRASEECDVAVAAEREKAAQRRPDHRERRRDVALDARQAMRRPLPHPENERCRAKCPSHARDEEIESPTTTGAPSKGELL